MARINSKPSAYACMSPYSMPLCTIFTKWPAPSGPDVRVARLQRGGERAEHGLHQRDGLLAAAHHEAVALRESPYAAADPGVHHLDAPAPERFAAPHRVVVVRVAAVHYEVAGLEHVAQRGNGRFRRVAGRHHRPHHPWSGKRFHELLQRVHYLATGCNRRLADVRVAVVGDDAVTAQAQAFGHVAPHASQPHHADVHSLPPV